MSLKCWGQVGCAHSDGGEPTTDTPEGEGLPRVGRKSINTQKEAALLVFMCIILEEGSATILSLAYESFVTSIGLGHWGPWHDYAHVNTPSLTQGFHCSLRRGSRRESVRAM